MKDLELYKNEIFERSEKRIRKRKSLIRGLTAFCIPFVMATVIFSAYIIPSMKSSDKAEPENASPEHSELSNGSTNNHLDENSVVSVYASIVKKQGGNVESFVKIVDSDTVSDLFEEIESSLETFAGCQTEQADGSSGTIGPSDVYEITFYGIKDTDRVFVLTDNVIVDKSTSKTFAVNNELVSKIINYSRVNAYKDIQE